MSGLWIVPVFVSSIKSMKKSQPFSLGFTLSLATTKL